MKPPSGPMSRAATAARTVTVIAGTGHWRVRFAREGQGIMANRERAKAGNEAELRGVGATVQLLAAGKRALTDALVQQAQGTGAEAAGGAGSVHAAAAHGISGSSTSLPHGEQIQRLFGRHDISSIQAHTDGAAVAGTRAMGAEAYATGNHVAFAGTPDLHTAAHEAAHVVQQRAGVHLKGGVGAVGDAYERNADDVADRVVQGKSAEDLLPGGGGAASAGGAVQKKDGVVTHTATVGAGKATARENDLDPSDKTNDNYSLEYAGADADKAHWLQFVNFSMIADVPGTGQVYDTGNVPTSSGNKPYSTDKVTNWSIDSASGTDPYYEATGSNVRTPGKGTKIFDEPGGATIIPLASQFVTTKAAKATKVHFVARFDTYLVVDGTAKHHVTWTATTDYDPAKKTVSAIAYTTGAAGDVKGLTKAFKTLLDTSYAGNTIK